MIRLFNETMAKKNLLFAFSIVILSFVFFKNAWVSEDAYIVFRSIDQLFIGNGPVWNPHERVQVFTSPLWFTVLATARLFSKDLYLNTIIVSFILWVGTILVLRRIFKDDLKLLLAGLLLVASNAFYDYTSSGLENILAYFILVLYIFHYRTLFKLEPEKAQKKELHLRYLFLLFGLLICVRHDLLLILLPSITYASFIYYQPLTFKRWGSLFGLGSIPFGLYTLFSLIYYGFPFPNTAYAKLNTGIPKSDIVKQGTNYFLISFQKDTLTLLIIFGALILTLFLSKKASFRPLAYGIGLNLIYIIYVGGDFMLGRFFSYAYLLSVILLLLGIASINLRKAGGYGIIALLVIYLGVYPHTPLSSPLNHTSTYITKGVADERGQFFNTLSLSKYVAHISAGQSFPSHPAVSEAQQFRSSSDQLIVRENIGMYGYTVGTEKIIIDQFALSDPLLARLHVPGWWRIGHFRREIPAGYLASIENGDEQIEDPEINEFYEKLKIITQSDTLFSWERIETIILFNLGRYDHLLPTEEPNE